MLPKRKKTIVLTAVLVVIIGALVFLLPQRGPTIPEEEAIAKVRGHFGKAFLSVEKIELRPPRVQEICAIWRLGREPPNRVWVVEALLIDPSGRPCLAGEATAILHAYTGEILLTYCYWSDFGFHS